MKTYRLNSIVLGAALVSTTAGISRAEPSSDLMNSIHRLRTAAQTNTKADPATSKPAPAGITYWSWSRVQSITAGQSSVAVPVLSRRIVVEPVTGDFKVVPLQQPNSTPETK